MLNNRNQACDSQKRAYSKPLLMSRGNILEITKGGSGVPLDGLGAEIGPGAES